ncbi:MAG: PhoH family protein [Patescibacteria group bacterium]
METFGRKKKFVLCQSLFTYDPERMDNFGNNDLVIPLETIGALGTHANSGDNGRARNATQALRNIEVYRLRGNLRRGVTTSSGGTVIIDDGTPKNQINRSSAKRQNRHSGALGVAHKWMKIESGNPPEKRVQVIFVSKHPDQRIMADAQGITSQDYLSDKVIESIDQLYSGVIDFKIDEYRKDFIDKVYKEKVVPISDLWNITDRQTLFPNTCCRVKFPNGTTLLLRYKEKLNDRHRVLRFIPFATAAQKKQPAFPINEEQLIAYDLLVDPDIRFVSLVGIAGTGKTLIALLAGCHLFEKNLFRQISVYRPTHETGNRLGFLPGDLKEKFEPWMTPILDAITFIKEDFPETGSGSPKNTMGYESHPFSAALDMIERHALEIKPINFCKGSTFRHSYTVVDECQDLTPGEAKKIVSRCGPGSKFVITGDPTQIDNPEVDVTNNGITHVIQGFKGQPLAGTVTLITVERDELAELAARLL